MLFQSRKYSLTFVQPRASEYTHGWIVVFGASLVFIFNTSLTTSFNLLFQPIITSSDLSAINLATIIFTVLSNLTILATGFLIKDLSAKHFVIIGSCLLTIGLVSSVFVVSLTQLILTYSILCGIGIGLLNPALSISVLSSFSVSRNLAIGVTFAALGFGQLVTPILVNFIQKNVDSRTTIGIISGLSVIGIFGANLLAPIKWRNFGNQRRCSSAYRDDEQEPLLMPHTSNAANFVNDEKSSAMDEFARASDLDLLLDHNFLIISIGLAFVYAVSKDFTSIFPAFLNENMGIEMQSAVKIFYVLAISDIISRIIFPFMLSTISSINLFLFGVVGMSVIKLLFLHISMPISMIISLSVIFGVFKSLTVVNQIIIISDFCKNFCPRKLPGMLGLSFVIKSIFLAVLNYFFNMLTASPLVDTSIRIYSQLILQSLVIIIWILVL